MAAPERESALRADPSAPAVTTTLRRASVRPPDDGHSAIPSAAATPRVTEVPPPPDEAPPSRAKSPGAFVATFVVLVAYVGAIGFFQFVVPNAPSLVAQVGGGVAVAIVVFSFHSFMTGTYVDQMRRAEVAFRALLRFSALVAPSLVRWLVFACLTGMFVVAYYDLARWDPTPVARLRVLGACAMPVILAVSSAMLVERRFARGEFALELSFPPSMSMRDRTDWKFKIDRMWSYEAALMRESVQRMARHAAIFGFLGSAILTACAVILLGYARSEDELRHLVGLSVGAATTVSFTLNLGQILFRSASNDATARMMAWSARTLLVVSVATVFLGVAFLSGPGDSTDGKGYLFQGYKGALIVGVAVALLGERVLRAVKDRAASMLGVGTTLAARSVDLTQIEGLSDEDIARLAEEGLDSTHALAFYPTPRLFFSTNYSLQRLCDWQDQALLIARVGKTNAQMLREQYLVRGAVAARQLARDVCIRAKPDVPGAIDQGADKQSVVLTDEDEAAKLRALAKALGFTGVTQAVLGLRTLVDDEMIERLELFHHAVPIWQLHGEGERKPNG